MNTIYPWQQSQWEQLFSRFQQKILPHALLLSGAEGMGKHIFALTFAELLLCQQPQNNACGTCSSCQLLKAGTHPDLFIIQPEESGKNIKVNQIRELIDKVNQTAQQGNYQIVIIKPAEALNIAAANALLKTLEEPTGKVILLLVSHHPALLPATIRSRCQKIIFDTSNKDCIRNWLMHQLPAAKNLDLLLAATEFVPLQAYALATQDNIERRGIVIDNFSQLILNQLNPIKMASLCMQQDNSSELLTSLSLFLSDLIKLKLTKQTQFLIHQDKIVVMKSVLNKISIHNLLKIYDKLIEIRKLNAKNINLNAQLLFEDFYINCQRLIAC